jgi:hypothetical protein
MCQVNNHMPRNPLIRIILIAVTVFCGLSSRHFAQHLPVLVASYGGDTLYALNLFLIAGLLLKTRPTWQIALIAFACSFGIELSQLYHAPWIDAVRATKVGGIVLGFGFLWSDIACYTVGVALGAAGEILADAVKKETGNDFNKGRSD